MELNSSIDNHVSFLLNNELEERNLISEYKNSNILFSAEEFIKIISKSFDKNYEFINELKKIKTYVENEIAIIKKIYTLAVVNNLEVKDNDLDKTIEAYDLQSKYEKSKILLNTENFIRFLSKEFIKSNQNKIIHKDLLNKENQILESIASLRKRCLIFEYLDIEGFIYSLKNFKAQGLLTNKKVVEIMHTDHLFYLLLYGPNLSLRVWMDQNLDDEEIYYINNGISIEYEKRKEENEFTSTGKHNSFTDTSYSENTTESFYSTGLDDSGIIESLGE